MSVAAAPPVPVAVPTTSDIYKKWFDSPLRAATNAVRSSTTVYTTYYTGQGFKDYALSVLMFSLLYIFLAFLILLIVHYSIRPVFSFVPGGTGLITVSTATDDKVYWNDKKQPAANSRVPLDTDALANYPFENNFTVSVDLYIRRPTDTAQGRRVLFYKTYRCGSGTGAVAATGAKGADIVNPVAALTPTTTATLVSDMATTCSMMAYLDENDLYVVMFTGTEHTELSTPAIKNIPVYTPFRLSVIVETKIFTVYINEKQVFQRLLGGSGTSTSILKNMYSTPPSAPNSLYEFFYSPPTWTESPAKTIFVQNFHLWPRAITYSELKAAQPSLAAEADFNLSVESGSTSCP